ncbi:hypothetical protein, variant [Thecamonas trahens ATCC 50062]|uniref:Transmembrane protein n=1 Tax=Thecamonas trahens ATCC 50062 TaxID=461836 RepID=A0A0L0DEM3_THETB|nr:hypothetical protein, variant [Thecamonas trahens ATCC 50062]KNC49778.1 hypothetical protein, variant [Thecamonas trahens ATCC 50062]|eukprot:XP_013757562.1 hypothetical protein, variant [Thecamonas trahens ATCC 50062]
MCVHVHVHAHVCVFCTVVTDNTGTEVLNSCRTYKEALDEIKKAGGTSDNLERLVLGSYVASTGIVVSVVMLAITMIIAVYMTCSETKDRSTAGQGFCIVSSIILVIVAIFWYMHCIHNSKLKTRDWKHLSYGYYGIIVVALFAIGCIFDLKRDFDAQRPAGEPVDAQADNDDYWTV